MALVGIVEWATALAAAEAGDSAALNSLTSDFGPLASVEPADSAITAATVSWLAALAVAENGDQAALSGAAIPRGLLDFSLVSNSELITAIAA